MAATTAAMQRTVITKTEDSFRPAPGFAFMGQGVAGRVTKDQAREPSFASPEQCLRATFSFDSAPGTAVPTPSLAIPEVQETGLRRLPGVFLNEDGSGHSVGFRRFRWNRSAQ